MVIVLDSSQTEMFPHSQPIKTDHLRLNKTFHSSRNKSDVLNNASKPESESNTEKKKTKKQTQVLHVPDLVDQKRWSCCSWIIDDLQVVQGPLTSQAWVYEVAGLPFAGTCWLHPLNPSLREERNQLWPTLLAWLSDKWHVQPQGTVVSSCLWTFFKVSSPQLLSYCVLLPDCGK